MVLTSGLGWNCPCPRVALSSMLGPFSHRLAGLQAWRFVPVTDDMGRAGVEYLCVPGLQNVIGLSDNLKRFPVSAIRFPV